MKSRSSRNLLPSCSQCTIHSPLHFRTNTAPSPPLHNPPTQKLGLSPSSDQEGHLDPSMAASSGDDDVEVDAEVLDLGVAVDLDPATYKVFFSDGDGDDSTEPSTWPAAEAIPSALPVDRDSLLALCRRFRIPDTLTPVSATGCAASATPADGAVCVYTAALEAGMRLPLHGFYLKLLRHYRLAPSQLTPNSWAYMAAFVLLCEDAGVEPRVSVFRYFFTICAHKNGRTGPPSGWHHFQPVVADRRLFTGHLPSKAGWKSRFFFLVPATAAASWTSPVKWGKPRRADVRRQLLTDAVVKCLLEKVGKTGIDVKKFLLRRQFPVGLQSDAVLQLEMPVKRENASTGKRKSPEKCATTPPAVGCAPASTPTMPLEFTPTPTPASDPTPTARSPPPGYAPMPTPPPLGSAATPTPPELDSSPPAFHPAQRNFGMRAVDALQLWEAMAASEKVQLRNALREAEDKVAELRADLREVHDWGSQLMEHLSAAASKITRLEKEHAADMARLQEEHDAKVERLTEAAAEEMRDAEARAKKKAVLALFPNLDPSLLEQISKLD